MDADVNKILFVTGGYDSTIKLWRPHIGTIVKSFQHPDSPVNCLCISPFKKCIYSGGFQKIRKYDKETSSLPICVYDNFQKNITSMKINSDEKWLLSSGEDGCLRIWDLRINKSSQIKYEFESSQNSCCIHSNDIVIYSCGTDGKINICDIRAEKTQSHKSEKMAELYSISINKQSTLIATIDGELYSYYGQNYSRIT